MTTTEDKPPKARRKGRRFSLTVYFVSWHSGFEKEGHEHPESARPRVDAGDSPLVLRWLPGTGLDRPGHAPLPPGAEFQDLCAMQRH